MIGLEVSEQDLAADLMAIIDAAAETYPGADVEVLEAYKRSLRQKGTSLLALARDLGDYLEPLDLAPLAFSSPVNEIRAIYETLLKG